VSLKGTADLAAPVQHAAKLGGLRGKRVINTRFKHNYLAFGSLIVLILFIGLILIGPYFTQNPNFADPSIGLRAPSWHHLFGTDELGRDIFARVIVGGRVSMFVAISATTASLLAGLVLGVFTGYTGGLVDSSASRIFDVLITFPTLLIGIILAAAFGASMTSVIAALALGQIPVFGRLFRAGTISAASEEYVQGAIALGFPPLRIIFKHILPNVIGTVLVVATGQIGSLAIAESSLSFIGAGIQPPTASWGNMVSGGEPFLQIAWWFPVIPGLFLIIVSLAFSFVGDGLRDAFDVRGGRDVQVVAATAAKEAR
jgi:ABC-type dipeptide/oligopeptide/nickel transport system permease subunit